jgi:hypothetical protein
MLADIEMGLDRDETLSTRYEIQTQDHRDGTWHDYPGTWDDEAKANQIRGDIYGGTVKTRLVTVTRTVEADGEAVFEAMRKAEQRGYLGTLTVD